MEMQSLNVTLCSRQTEAQRAARVDKRQPSFLLILGDKRTWKLTRELDFQNARATQAPQAFQVHRNKTSHSQGPHSESGSHLDWKSSPLWPPCPFMLLKTLKAVGFFLGGSGVREDLTDKKCGQLSTVFPLDLCCSERIVADAVLEAFPIAVMGERCKTPSISRGSLEEQN